MPDSDLLSFADPVEGWMLAMREWQAQGAQAVVWELWNY